MKSHRLLYVQHSKALVFIQSYLSANLDLPNLQTFKNPKPQLAALLAESGPMENGTKKKDESAKKKKRVTDKGVCRNPMAVNIYFTSYADIVVRLIWRN